jgi:hypothetical protein
LDNREAPTEEHGGLRPLERRRGVADVGCRVTMKVAATVTLST